MTKMGWQVKTINDIAIVKGGKRVPKGYKLVSSPTAHPYITVSDFNDKGSIDINNIRYLEQSVYELIKNYTISSNDLYISIAGTIGKTGIIPLELDGANLTENACKLVFRNGIDRRFVYYFTTSDSFKEQTGINTRIAAQPKLALERLKTIEIPIPDIVEQKRIVSILDDAFSAIDQAIANTEKNISNAHELFENYLNGVFTQKGEGWREFNLHEILTNAGFK